MIAISTTLIIVVLLMGAVGFVLYRRLVETLRDEHQDLWQAIGRPGLVFYSSIDGQRKAHRFFSQREYETLGDSDFVQLCRVYRVFARSYSIVVGATCASLLLASVGIGVA